MNTKFLYHDTGNYQVSLISEVFINVIGDKMKAEVNILLIVFELSAHSYIAEGR